MAGKLIVITGLDGSGTSSVGERLCALDPVGISYKTPSSAFEECRSKFDGGLRSESPAAHYLYYLSSVVYASAQIEEHLKTRNVYCVRYLIDTVVSHRVAGLDVNLDYETAYYKIRKPDVTLFLNINEGIRQTRISARGKSELDMVLDDDMIRSQFLKEFSRYSGQYYEIDNSTQAIEDAVMKAAKILPWLNG